MSRLPTRKYLFHKTHLCFGHIFFKPKCSAKSKWNKKNKVDFSCENHQWIHLRQRCGKEDTITNTFCANVTLQRLLVFEPIFSDDHSWRLGLLCGTFVNFKFVFLPLFNIFPFRPLIANIALNKALDLLLVKFYQYLIIQEVKKSPHVFGSLPCL